MATRLHELHPGLVHFPIALLAAPRAAVAGVAVPISRQATVEHLGRGAVAPVLPRN